MIDLNTFKKLSKSLVVVNFDKLILIEFFDNSVSPVIANTDLEGSESKEHAVVVDKNISCSPNLLIMFFVSLLIKLMFKVDTKASSGLFIWIQSIFFILLLNSYLTF